MANRYDALTVSKYVDRNGDEKSFFTKIGTMFQSKNGDTYSWNLLHFLSLIRKARCACSSSHRSSVRVRNRSRVALLALRLARPQKR